MSIKNILLIVFILLLLYVIIQYIMKGSSTLTSISSAQTMQTISSSKLATTTSSANTSNFCYSIWFYIDDWNYRYGEEKVIFGRMSTGTRNPCPLVTLGAMQNNINISMEVYGGAASSSASSNSKTSTPAPVNSGANIHKCNVSNVPLQRWVNLIISAYGRSLDIYIDGKLVRTCVLPGVAKIDPNANAYVTPNGGFSGWTSLFQYWPASCDPQKAWNIYKKGYGGSWLGTLSQYSVKVSLMKGNTEDGSVQI